MARKGPTTVVCQYLSFPIRVYIQTKKNHFTFDLCVMKKSSLVQTPKSIGGHVPALDVLINCSVSLNNSQVNFSLYFFN